MKQKRILSLSLALMMLLSMVPANMAFAAETIDATIFARGSGTEADPYRIETPEQLEKFRDAVNGGNSYSGKYVKLANDIDLEGDESKQWTPIGQSKRNTSHYFEGTFDGDGHAITNLYSEIGLFGYTNNATIKNLSVSGTVQTSSYSYSGGIVGYAMNSTIENCVNHADISGTTYAGGIAGEGYGTNIRNCVNTGAISGVVNVGGIVGEHIQHSQNTAPKINDCYNTGDIKREGTKESDYKGVGGIAGLTSGSTIEKCYNYGEVDGTDATEHVGGVVGYMYGQTDKVDPKTVFYLDDCVKVAEGVTATAAGTAKTAAEFESGAVAYALQGERATQVWGQELGKDKTPILTSAEKKAVRKITFETQTDKPYAERYVNHGKTLEKYNFPDEPTLVEGPVFHHWSQTSDVDGTEFTNMTKVETDMTVYAVGMKKTGAAEDDDVPKDTISVVKGTDIGEIDLNKFVMGTDGEESDWKFTFTLAEGSTLPEGVTFDAEHGIIKGTPTKAKYGKVVFNVTNNQIAMMSLDDTGTQLTLNFDISFKGKGTSEEPYLIEELEDLEYLRDKVNDYDDFSGKYVKIADDTDIDMSAKYSETTGTSWTPIGTGVRKTGTASNEYIYSGFAGTFEGNNNTIKNLYIKANEADGYDRYALFGLLNPGATVQNLTVEGSVTGRIGTYYVEVGGIVGDINRYGSTEEVKILNCTNKATVQIGDYVGGVVGRCNGIIENCVNEGTVSADTRGWYIYAGGVTGSLYTQSGSYSKVKMTNCTNNGTVTMTVIENDEDRIGRVGGITGAVDSYAEATECTNNGTVLCDSAEGAYLKELDAGGIAGYAEGKVNKCKNNAAVKAENITPAPRWTIALRIGGIIGRNDAGGKCVKCTNTVSGTVTVDNSRGNVGGIVGYNYRSTLEDCTNEAKITGETGFIGGIVGVNEAPRAESKSYVTGCVNNGEVLGYNVVGGIAGGNYGMNESKTHVYISQCYNTATVTQRAFTSDSKTNDIFVGGVVGVNKQPTENCYSIAPALVLNAITGGTGTTVNYYVGGVAGRTTHEVKNSWSNTTKLGNNVNGSADVTTNYYVGGAVGERGKNGTQVKSVTNCYYLDDGLTRPDNAQEPTATDAYCDIKACTAEQFTSGEVTWLLQNGQTDPSQQVWGQDITSENKDAHPMLTTESNNMVCKVTFLKKGTPSTTYDEVGTAQYTNNGKCVTLPTTNPTSENYTFSHWTTATVLGLGNDDEFIFTAQTPVTARDTRVFAVGKEKTVAEGVPEIKVQKSKAYTETDPAADLKDYVANKSGNEGKNFYFGVVNDAGNVFKNDSEPDGLKLDYFTGLITGTPKKAGYYTVTIGADNQGLALMSTEGANSTDESSLTFDLEIEVTLAQDATDGAYTISDLEELEYFRDSVNKGEKYEDKTVKLLKDIDMSKKYNISGENWEPIGDTDVTCFNGTFNGNGKTINGLYAFYAGKTEAGAKGTKENVGLFGVVESKGIIKNLSVTGGNGDGYSVCGYKNVGGIVGTCKGTIAGCSNAVSVWGNNNVGGIAGYGDGLTVENCRNTATKIQGDVPGDRSECGVSGGLVGYAKNVTIRNCYNDGAVNGGTLETNDGTNTFGWVGGIAGCGDGLTVENCYNSGKIGTRGTNGALVGYVQTSAVVQKCIYLTGTAAKAVGNKDNFGTALNEMSEADFAGGRVAYTLENYASENAAEGYTQVWGQKLGSPTTTDTAEADKAPVLTSDPAAKVYAIKLAVNKPWADEESDREYKELGTTYGNIGREITLDEPGSDVIDKPGRFRDWSKTENGDPLNKKYTPTGNDDKVYSLWNTVTFEVSDTEKTYAQGVAQEISFTPYLNGTKDSSIADKFKVSYYEFDENTDTLKMTQAVKAKAQGTYLYVINAANDDADNTYYIDGEYKVTDGVTELPDEWEKTYKNIDIMTVTANVPAQQKPITFADGIVNVTMSNPTVNNPLNDENGGTVTYTSSKPTVAAVDPETGKVTVKQAGTATITATSVLEGTTPVYATYTLIVTKEVITVTANDVNLTYGQDFANNGYQLPNGVDENKITGQAEFDVDYQAGDGVGTYTIEVSGLQSDIYDIEYKSGKLKVGKKDLTANDFIVTVTNKEYDKSAAADVTAVVKTESLGNVDDVVNVLVSGNFAYATVNDANKVSYTISGLSGKDAANYAIKGADDKKVITGEDTTARITPAQVTVSVPSKTTYVYDENAKGVNVMAYANGVYFSDVTVKYAKYTDDTKTDTEEASATEPTAVGCYKIIVVPNDTANYAISGEITAELEIKSAQQDFFSIEGISDTVTYGNTGIQLQAAGAIDGGKVKWEVTNGDAATVDATSGAVTITGVGTVTVKATSTKNNYTDKVATRTFVVQPKTLTVTVTADDQVYDGDTEADVDPTLNGILQSDENKVNLTNDWTANTATADVENNKTVFVSGLALEGNKADCYTLASTSLQSKVNITKKEITAVTIEAKEKVYDGNTDATYTVKNLEGVIPADKDFVTVTGTATFADANAGEGKTVTLSNPVLSGSKSGNYELKLTGDTTATAKIKQATVNFTFGTLSYVYDGKAKEAQITATVNGVPFGKKGTDYFVTYGTTGDNAENRANVGNYPINITLANANSISTNYTSDYTNGSQELVIANADQEHMTITGLPGTIEYGDEFTLYTAGGYSGGKVTWAVTDGNAATVDENTGVVKINGIGKVTITATNTDAKGNYNTQTASITFTPATKQVSFKITGLSQTYDGSAKSVTVTTEAEEDSYTVTYTDEDNQTVEPANVKNAGTYYVDVKANADSNYIGEQSAVLTIKKGKLSTESISLSVANDDASKDTITYGDTYSVTTSGYTGEYGTRTYTGTGISAATTSAPKNAGSYMVTLTINDPNYETAAVTKEFTIAKAELTATANDQTREYGQNNEPLTVTLTGFVNGEKEDKVLIMPIASTTANSSSDVGEYPITVSGGYAENYSFKYVNGTLKVEAATEGYIDIRNANTNPYVGDSFTPQAWFNGKKINATWTTETPNILSIDESGKVTVNGVGEATLTATATSDNCKGLTTSITIHARKKQITLDQFGTTVQTTYTGAAQKIAFTAGSIDLTGVTINATYMKMDGSNDTNPIDVGTYMVMYNIADDRYEGSGTCYLTINKAEVAVKAKDVHKTYGDEFTAYELDWNGENGLDESVKEKVLKEIEGYMTFTSTGAPEAAEVQEGGYPIEVTASQTETKNVKFTVTGGTLTVDPKQLIIAVQDVTRTYGEENPTPEVTYNDFATIGGVKETTDVLEGELAFTYEYENTPITAETAVGTYADGVQASGVTAKNYAIEFVPGDVNIVPIAVTATAGVARATYLTVRFDKALAGLTDANFTVQEGDIPVALTEVSASSDNKTYTLKGTFTVGTAYTVAIDLTGTEYAPTHAINGSPLTITPSNPSSGGGGGGGTSTYTVKFETNGGSAIDSVKVKKNETVTEPAVPTKEGFDFAGWYADKKLTQKYDFTAKVTKTMTLYAAWTEKAVEPEPEPTPSTPEWQNPFTDVEEGDWFCEYVKYVNENALMNGITATTFEPDSDLTRGMFVTVLYRAEGTPAVNRSIPFADVKADSYYANAVNWAQQNEIVKGVSENEFAPEEKITREQIATIMFRYAQYKGIAPEGAWAIRMDYADVAEISDYAAEGVMYCTLKGIMQGKDGNRFAPKENATRAEIAAILQRFIEGNK